MIPNLSPEASEFFSERAAIREYLGGHTRDEAERLALAETLEWQEARRS